MIPFNILCYTNKNKKIQKSELNNKLDCILMVYLVTNFGAVSGIQFHSL